MRFTDKVVAITGAAQGIGRQTAEQAATEGAALLLIDPLALRARTGCRFSPCRKSGTGAGG